MTTSLDAVLAALRAEFPEYQIWVDPAGGGRRLVARRLRPGPGPHTVVTSDPEELGAALAAARVRREPGPAGRAGLLPLPHARPVRRPA